MPNLPICYVTLDNTFKSYHSFPELQYNFEASDAISKEMMQVINRVLTFGSNNLLLINDRNLLTYFVKIILKLTHLILILNNRTNVNQYCNIDI